MKTELNSHQVLVTACFAEIMNRVVTKISKRELTVQERVDTITGTLSLIEPAISGKGVAK